MEILTAYKDLIFEIIGSAMAVLWQCIMNWAAN